MYLRIPRYIPSEANKSVLSADYFGPDVSLASRREAPSTRTKRLIQNSAIFDLGEVNNAIYKKGAASVYIPLL